VGIVDELTQVVYVSLLLPVRRRRSARTQGPCLVDLVGEPIRLVVVFDGLPIPPNGIILTDNLLGKYFLEVEHLPHPLHIPIGFRLLPGFLLLMEPPKLLVGFLVHLGIALQH
jgi:hypothetical protein